MKSIRLIFSILLVMVMTSATAHQAKYDTSRYVLNLAPKTIAGTYMKATYFSAKGKFRQFLGETFQNHFTKSTFTSRTLAPTQVKAHGGDYSYHRMKDYPGVAMLNVTHHKGSFKNLKYHMILVFYSSMHGVFKVMSGGKVVGAGTFYLS